MAPGVHPAGDGDGLVREEAEPAPRVSKRLLAEPGPSGSEEGTQAGSGVGPSFCGTLLGQKEEVGLFGLEGRTGGG